MALYSLLNGGTAPWNISFLELVLKSGLSAFFLLIALPAKAQISADGTVGTQVNLSESASCLGGACTITGGTTVGENLFHSFREFSIPPGGAAVFDSGNVRNIFSRVTGENPSLVDGLISSPGDANLFLLNPNGLVFGSNAALAIGGSFVGSTADRVLFSNGAEFSAQDPTLAPSLLTVTTPVGLQTGDSPGSLVVQGFGNNLFFNPETFEVVRDFRPPGLATNPGNTLALIGGDILIQGGNLTAPGGHIELGSVGDNATVSLDVFGNNLNFNYGSGNSFQTIQLTQAASVDTSGSGGGSIRAQGDTVLIREGSTFLNDTLGDVSGGSLSIQADTLDISGVSPLAPFLSSIYADAGSTATASGGDIELSVRNLTVADGGQIGASTFGVADGGRLRVQAETIDLSGGALFGDSGLFAVVAPGASGDGGDLIINAREVSVVDGAQLSISSNGTGTTGDLSVAADTLRLSGFSEFLGVFPSAITADLGPEVIANGGSLVLDVNNLQIDGGAQISSGTFGSAGAGSIQISASEVQLVGDAQLPSGIFAPVAFGATGAGGRITIAADRLQISEGAQIASSTLGFGSAGSVQIDSSEIVRLSGQTASGFPSGIFASSADLPGSGGNIAVTTGRLEVVDGARVSVRNAATDIPGLSPFSDQGGAGDLRVLAPFVLLDNQAALTAETETGSRGNISLTTDLLLLRRGSSITTSAQGTASGGNIFIDASGGFIVAKPIEDSNISANAVLGSGGRVDIFTQGLIGIEPRPSPTPLSDITASSEFGVSGTVTVSNPNADPVTEEADLPDTIGQPRLLQGCETAEGGGFSQFIQSGRSGLRPSPYEALTSSQPLGDVQPPQSWLEQATVLDPAQGSQVQTDSIEEAQGWHLNESGELMLVARLPDSDSRSMCRYVAPTLSLPVLE